MSEAVELQPGAELTERTVDVRVGEKPASVLATAFRMDDGRWDPGCVVSVAIGDDAREVRHLSFGDAPFFATAAEALDAAVAAGTSWARDQDAKQ